MALTKGQLADLIIDSKSGGDATANSKYHPLNIHKLISIVYNTLVEIAFFQARKNNSYELPGDFITAYKNVEIKFDDSIDKYYSDMPASLVSLPKNRGLHQVSLMKGQNKSFNIVENGSDYVFDLLEAHHQSSVPDVFIEGQKLFYTNLGNQKGPVLVKMVSSIDDLPENKTIPIPAIMESDLLARVSAMLDETKATVQDKTNDTNTQP